MANKVSTCVDLAARLLQARALEYYNAYQNGAQSSEMWVTFCAYDNALAILAAALDDNYDSLLTHIGATELPPSPRRTEGWLDWHDRIRLSGNE